MQNLWYLIRLLMLITATGCIQKQKAVEQQPVNPKPLQDSLSKTLVAGTDSTAIATKLDSLPTDSKSGKSQNAPVSPKGNRAKGKEVHAPMPEKKQVKDAARLERERLKRKREGRE